MRKARPPGVRRVGEKHSALQGRGLEEGKSCAWPLSTAASEQARKPAYLSPEGERAGFVARGWPIEETSMNWFGRKAASSPARPALSRVYGTWSAPAPLSWEADRKSTRLNSSH